jgi:hypothetical protein
VREVRRRLTPGWPTAVVWGGGALLIVTVKYGIGLHPNWFRFSDAVETWPDMAGSLLAVGDRALLSNSAHSWIAGALGLPGGGWYIALSLAMTAVALTLPYLMRHKPDEETFRRLALLAVVGGALAPVLLMWVGGYDALLVIGLTVGALARTPVIGGVGWFVAAATHSAVAIPAAAACIAFVSISRHVSLRRGVSCATAAVAGLALGWLVMRVATDHWGGSTDRLALFHAIPYHLIIESYLAAWPAILFSGLAFVWVLLLSKPIRERTSTKIFGTFAIIIVLLTPMIAVDQTRITALLLVPLTLTWLDRLATEGLTLRRIWRRSILPAVVLPVPVVWMGVSHWPYWL